MTRFSLLWYFSPSCGGLMRTVSYLHSTTGNNIIHANNALEQTKF